jgi:hypothetical protein
MVDLEAALIELKRLPALQHRRVLASYAEHARRMPDGKQRETLHGAG